MIELFVLAILTLVVIAIIRPGKTPPLDKPLIIERPGQHHITLAPQLNLAQPLIEAISKELAAQGQAQEDCPTVCFEVRDKQVRAHGQPTYLLAVTRRNRMLYFQAIPPRPLVRDGDSHFKTLMEFAQAVLTNTLTPAAYNTRADEQIAAAIRSVAQKHQVEIKRLLD